MIKTSLGINTIKVLLPLVVAIILVGYWVLSKGTGRTSETPENALAQHSQLQASKDSSDDSTGAASNKISGLNIYDPNLDITILAVIASNDPLVASATVRSKQHVRTYFIDDQIAYTNAILKRVSKNNIVVHYRDQDEVIVLQPLFESGSVNDTVK